MLFKSVFAHMGLSHSSPPAPTSFLVDDISLLQIQGRMRTHADTHTQTHTDANVCMHASAQADLSSGGGGLKSDL